MRQALAALQHFPVCGSLSVHSPLGESEWRPPTLRHLSALLRQAGTLSCHSFALSQFRRADAGNVQPRRLGKRSVREVRSLVRPQPFDWTDIRLPSVTRLSLLVLCARDRKQTGVPAFLTAHTALLELAVSTPLVSVDELTALASDAAALPHLTRLSLLEPYEACGQLHDLTPLLTALGRL